MNLIKILFAYIKNFIFMLFTKHNKNKDISLIFPDRWLLSEDNALFMFKYCLENDIQNIYLVCLKNRSNIEILKKNNIYDENRILWFGSKKCLNHMANYKVAYYSHSYLHCFPFFLTLKKFKATKYVFITHGMTLLKEHNYKDYKFTFLKSDIILKNYIQENIYFEKPIYETCLFTNYYQNKCFFENNKAIYIPTWIKIKNYKSFLKSHIVKQIEFLNKQNIHFDIHSHKYIKKYMKKYCKQNNLNFIDKSINEIISNYSICYTDNSSIALDFAFLNKKVFLVNYKLPMYRLTEYRKTMMFNPIVELNNIVFIKKLNIDWIS